MKFSSIGLIRYGRFTDRQIDLAPGASVVVIEGANEAGKTTAMHAVADLLFGIEERSRFNFLHDYRSMRLTATIVGTDGRTLSLARLKRRNAALLNAEDDSPLPDDALAPFLGAHDRRAFLDIYGLDQQRLRSGGQQMVTGGGALAETLLSVAPGLAHVARLRDQLQQGAAEVFNPARRNAGHLFYKAMDRRAQAREQLQRLELRADEVKATRAAFTAAQETRQSAEQAETEAALAVARAEALRQAARELRLLAAQNRILDDLGPLPVLEAGDLARIRARLEAHIRAQEDLSRARQEEEAAQAVHAAIQVDAAILAIAGDVEQCVEEYVAMRDRRAALPNRARERDSAHLALGTIARDLHLESVADLRARLPARPLLARATELADQLRTQEARAHALREEGEKLALKRREAVALLQEHGAVEDPAPLMRRFEALDGAEARAESLGTLQARLRALHTAWQAQMARLPFGPHDFSSLLALPLPDPASAERQREACDAALDAVARLEAHAGELRDEQARTLARLKALDAGGTAPTPAAITAARTSRDALWMRLRPLATGARSPSAEDAAHAEALDLALTTADRLADDRQTETQRLADMARTTLDLADIEARLSISGRKSEAARTRLDEEQAKWTALWAASALSPPPAQQALGFLREVETIRAEHETALREEAQAKSLSAAVRWDREEVQNLRHALGLSPLGEGPLRMAELRAVLRARAEAYQARRDSQRDLARLDEAAADHARRQEYLAGRDAALQQETAAVFPALCIRPQATADEARAAIELWHDALTRHGDLETAERRITQIQQDEKDFIAHIRALCARIGADEPDDAYGAAVLLRNRLKVALEAQGRARDAGTALAARTHARKAAAERADQAREQLQPALELGGLSDPEALPAWLERMEKARKARAEQAEIRARLDDIRGDRPVEEMRAAIDDADDETLTRQVAACAAAREEARRARDLAVERATQARFALDALEQREGAAEAAQQEQDALAEITETMDRFTREHVAARLLSRAIERYREAHQHPIVTRASAAFRTLTNGRWEGIAVDYDADTPRLAAAREGRLVGFEGLSEGTADQLFLALRVAAIEEHARRATPLPFLADDLFVSFDEERTQAGLRLLGEMGAHTQVIVFTHHRHVTECAQRVLGDSACLIRL